MSPATTQPSHGLAILLISLPYTLILAVELAHLRCIILVLIPRHLLSITVHKTKCVSASIVLRSLRLHLLLA